jgi:hypothetical protein
MSKIQKSAWQQAKELVEGYAVKDLKENYGLEVTTNQITPKTHRGLPDHILLYGHEFAKNLVYIIYKKQYKLFSDENGEIVDSPQYFMIDKEKVAAKVATGKYSKAHSPTASDESWEFPFEDMVKLKPLSSEVEEVAEDEIEDDTDQNISALTIRDFYAILQNKPVSAKPWLNKLISKNNVRNQD